MQTVIMARLQYTSILNHISTIMDEKILHTFWTKFGNSVLSATEVFPHKCTHKKHLLFHLCKSSRNVKSIDFLFQQEKNRPFLQSKAQKCNKMFATKGMQCVLGGILKLRWQNEVKFGLSEKHTKFEKIFLMVWTFTK